MSRLRGVNLFLGAVAAASLVILGGAAMVVAGDHASAAAAAAIGVDVDRFRANALWVGVLFALGGRLTLALLARHARRGSRDRLNASFSAHLMRGRGGLDR